jgi:hypothetical protein
MSGVNVECVQERNGTWHAAMGDQNPDFILILCGHAAGEGINMPGWIEHREPTCLGCLDVLAARIVDHTSPGSNDATRNSKGGFSCSWMTTR